MIVVGDIHGQYFDLINIINEAKKAHSTQGPLPTYLFLGDYVDRGYYSCEVMLYLLSLKVAHPDRVWLLRGNHECASVSGHFGFKEECKMKYGVNIYYSFLLLFQTLPLGAIITTAFGDIYACHGGLSPSLSTIEEIEAIDRMVEPEGNLGLMDILWADPINDENVENMTADEYQAFIDIDWRPNPTRGCSYVYGFKSIKEFLKRNNLVCLVRAHEVQEEGYRKHFAPEIMESKILALQKQLDVRKMLRIGSQAEVEQKHKSAFMDCVDCSPAQTSAGAGVDIAKPAEAAAEDALSEEACGVTAATATSSDSGTPESQLCSVTDEKETHGGGAAVGGDTFSAPLAIDLGGARPCEELDDTESQEVAIAVPRESGLFTLIDQLEDFPPVITIFSAPNYCDRYQNRGAILLIDAALDQFRLIQYDCVDHPKPEIVESQNTNLVELIIQTCPYMPLSFRNFVRLAVELGEDSDLENELSGDAAEYESDSDLPVRKPDYVVSDADMEPLAVLNMNDELAVEKPLGIAMDAVPLKGEEQCVDGTTLQEHMIDRSDSDKGGGEDQILRRMSSGFSVNSEASVDIDMKSLKMQQSVSPALGTKLPPRGKSDDMLRREPSSYDVNSQASRGAESEHPIYETPAPVDRVSPSLPYSKFKRRGSKTISLIRQSSWTKGSSNFESSLCPSISAVNALSHSNSSDCNDDFGQYASPQSRSQTASPVVHYDLTDPRSLTDLETHLSPRNSEDAPHRGFFDDRELDDMKENIEQHLNQPVETQKDMKKRKSSNVYMQALASDALNEVHPAMVNAFVQQFKGAYESSVKRKFQMSVFQVRTAPNNYIECACDDNSLIVSRHATCVCLWVCVCLFVCLIHILVDAVVT